ncbi:olfactory receptor 52E4-like [Denticeps clupeoides]|uniref:olfactory receptor 52E4-like n=1 Tax=Denticeps clupeoides TaxID=299321 RepID=UPI0010A4697C|nr:olfactory receptor 52E4-like [Denticeps clupeoides]
MDNMSTYSNVLHLEALVPSELFVIPVFFLMLLAYLTLLVSNIGVLILIITERSLHQPMYLLFCNLSINDITGSSVLLPRLLADLVSTQRLITYGECATQVFMIHMFGTASHVLLIIMAVDRYVAICQPLRYSAIMSTRTVIIMSAAAWGVTIALIFILVGLTLRLSRCRSYVMNSYCDNAALFKLSCEDVSVNNIYGLTFTVVLFTFSISSIAFTYTKIAVVCWTKKSKDLNSKAMQTCASHLVLYLVMMWTGLITIILHRFSNYPYLRKLIHILFYVVPGNLNPVIYGLQSKALRQKIVQIFHRKVIHE